MTLLEIICYVRSTWNVFWYLMKTHRNRKGLDYIEIFTRFWLFLLAQNLVNDSSNPHLRWFSPENRFHCFLSMRELFNCTESLDEKEEQQHYIWNDINDIANNNKANTGHKSDQKMLNSTVTRVAKCHRYAKCICEKKIGRLGWEVGKKKEFCKNW